MCEIENNINISWQLVSQFVSWDFCKYSCEKKDTENDVLTFLRNMIVERTEKAATDITKHEIIAKFIMEIKTIQTISRMDCLTVLAETVKRICPELNQAISKLLYHLESFLNILDWNEDTEKRQLLQARMALAVNEFSKEAFTVLPVPDMLQVVQTWLQLSSQSQKLKPKYPTNHELYNQVLTCLREEVRSFEIETIAKALYDDEALKTFMYKQSVEVLADSQNPSYQTSQVLKENSCPDSLQLSERYKLSDFHPHIPSAFADNSLSLEASPLKFPKKKNLQPLDSSSLEMCSDSQNLVDSIKRLKSLTASEAFLFENPNPAPLFPNAAAQSKTKFQVENLAILQNEFPARSFQPDFFSHNRTLHPVVINIQSCERESDGEDESYCTYKTQQPAILKHPRKKLISSESEDTSDCDKDPEFRFLTPTLFKKNNNQIVPTTNIYLSDQESCGSSIVTTVFNSQKDDPDFKTRTFISKPNISVKKKKLRSPKKKKQKRKIQDLKQTTLQQFRVASKPTNSSSANDSRIDFRDNTFKKKKRKLYNAETDQPVIDKKSSSNLVQNTKYFKESIQALGNKRHCTECSITFRTPKDLKKHIFIFHTEDDFNN